jgi:N-formylglutamate deformylase
VSEGSPLRLDAVPGTEPLVVSMPHTGVDLPEEILPRLTSAWLARKDTDWHIEQLYDFATALGATVIRTSVSRTVIDVNRDPTGESLYPGLATTELCPTTTFDGEPLYRPGCEPRSQEIASRRAKWFDPYHACLSQEIARLRRSYEHVVVYDCHSIRSVIPRLFDGELPAFNIGTDSGRSCDPRLTAAVEGEVAATGRSRVTNGRFRGGYITRHHGRPADGVHAIQMELAIRGDLREPVGPLDAVNETNWPPAYDPDFARPMKAALRRVLEACLHFAHSLHFANSSGIAP